MKRTRQRISKGTVLAAQQKLTPYSPDTTQFFLYIATLKEQLTFTSEKRSPEHQSKLHTNISPPRLNERMIIGHD